jgi:sensor histidine kinase YesM
MEQHIPINIKYHLNARHVLSDLIYTILISTLVAVFLTFTGIASKSFIMNLIVSLSFGISFCSITIFLFWIFKPEKRASLIFIAMIGIASGTLIGLQIGFFVLQQIFPITMKQPEKSLFQVIILAITFGGVAWYFFYSKARIRISNEVIQEEKIKRLSSEKETLEANLRLLQAQIEPHFLFNTLSNVLSLIDTNPANGKSMLVDLIHYMRISLSRTLPEATTLDQEMDMIKAYLNIQKIRMGERLHFKIELPDVVRKLPFPPMLLQPLVENAVKHGLEPAIEGGDITIKVMEENSLIRIEVQDTGNGFSSYETAGVGITNVRERIRLLYGDKGRLILQANDPHGVKAIIEVPKHGV